MKLSFFFFSYVKKLMVGARDKFTSFIIENETPTLTANSRTHRVIRIPLEGLLKCDCIVDNSISIFVHYTKLFSTFNVRKNIVDMSDVGEVVKHSHLDL
jgi:hypothetical protein